MKTAKALGITPEERKYLIKAERTLSTMRREQKVAIRGDGKFAFDMAVINRPLNGWFSDGNGPGKVSGTYECGTAGCIAGLMHIMASIDKKTLWGKSRIDSGKMSHPLLRLFFPGDVRHTEVTPKMAAKVIRRFLDTGEVYYMKTGR